jgi:heat shock protein HslJ
MKKRLNGLLLLLIVGVLTLAACDTLGGTSSDSDTPEGTEKTVYVGPEMVECEGAGPQQCLLIKENPEDEYTLWYQPIAGFNYEPGYEYELRVAETTVENPPADGSSIQWTLVEEVSKTPVSADATQAGAGSDGAVDGAAADSGEAATDASTTDEVTLENTFWTLVSYLNADGAMTKAIPGTTVSAEFVAGQVNGNASCNNYFGSYVVDGDALTIGPMGTSMMLCQPPALMAQESAYLGALESAATYSIEANQLTIYNANGDVAVVLESSEPLGLAGQRWIATSYNNGRGGAVSIVLDTLISAEFDDKGNMIGSAGCNNYSAGYEADDTTIKIGPPITTRKFCGEPEGIMEQENEYLAAIQNATVYTVRSNQLELRDDNGALQAAYTAVNQDAVNAVLVAALGNMTYQTEFTQSGEATLVAGKYSEPSAPDSATMTDILLTDEIAYGMLSDGANAAVNVLVTDPGGSGTFYDLHVVRPQDGKLTDITYISLGDRVQINTLDIVDGLIVVDMVQSGADDALCCPTEHVVNTYELQGTELVLVTSEVVEDAPDETGEASTAELTNTMWLFTQFAGSDDTTLNFEASDAYSLQLNDDGTFAAIADCKGTEGTYTLDGSSLTFALGASVTLYCGDDSYSDQYLMNLSNVVSYVFDDSGNLVLNLMADAGNMSYVAGTDSAPAEEDVAVIGTTWEWQGTTTPVESIDVPNPANYNLLLNEDGTFNFTADCNVGSGSYTVSDNQITLELGPITLAACGPESLDTVYLQQLGEVTSWFTNDEGEFFLEMPADAGTMRFAQAGTGGGGDNSGGSQSGNSADIVDVVWAWNALNTPVESVTVDNPQSYLMLLNPDGTVSIQADCNSGGGNYTIDGSNITIEILFTTQAFCGEASLDTLYIQSLNGAAIYFTQDGELFIDLIVDSGTMQFSPVESGA